MKKMKKLISALGTLILRDWMTITVIRYFSCGWMKFWENGTEQWIGQVDFSQKNFQDAIPLLEIKDHLDSITKEYGWESQALIIVTHFMKL